MGCHTWCYKRVNRSKEEAVSKYVALQEKKIGYVLDLILEEGVTSDDLEKEIQFYKDSIKDAENNVLCNDTIYSDQPEGVYEYVNGQFYVNIDKCHNPFRTGGYPEINLFSLKETLEYIDDSDNGCETHDKTRTLLMEFWDENPDGMINFG